MNSGFAPSGPNVSNWWDVCAALLDVALYPNRATVKKTEDEKRKDNRGWFQTKQGRARGAPREGGKAGAGAPAPRDNLPDYDLAPRETFVYTSATASEFLPTLRQLTMVDYAPGYVFF